LKILPKLITRLFHQEKWKSCKKFIDDPTEGQVIKCLDAGKKCDTCDEYEKAS
jgi:hypothetical protein